MLKISNIIFTVAKFLFTNKYFRILRYIPFLRILLAKIILDDAVKIKIKSFDNYTELDYLKFFIKIILKILLYLSAFIGVSIISYYQFNFIDISDVLLKIYNNTLSNISDFFNSGYVYTSDFFNYNITKSYNNSNISDQININIKISDKFDVIKTEYLDNKNVNIEVKNVDTYDWKSITFYLAILTLTGISIYLIYKGIYGTGHSNNIDLLDLDNNSNDSLNQISRSNSSSSSSSTQTVKQSK